MIHHQDPLSHLGVADHLLSNELSDKPDNSASSPAREETGLIQPSFRPTSAELAEIYSVWRISDKK